MRTQTFPRTLQLTALFSLLVFMMSLAFCSKSRQGPERHIQNGVEIAVNRTKPYFSQGGVRSVSSQEEFRIDLADEMYVKLGLSDISSFDINSQGQIFLFCRPTGDGPLVFKFDENGRFIRSFLRSGQGPGEVQYPRYEGVTTLGEILIFDTGQRKVFFFDEEGSLLRAIDIPIDLHPVGQPDIVPLENDNYLIQYFRLGPELEVHGVVLGVFDPSFNKVKDLVEFDLPKSAEKATNPFVTAPLSAHSLDAIYIGFTNKDAEVSVYNLQGELKRVMRKRSSPVQIPPEFERDLLERLPENHPLRKNLKLPRYFPASQYLFADEVGHLFVATYEKDKVTGQNMCDVFAPDGIFIQRMPLGYFDIMKWWWLGQSRDVVVRNGRMLCIREKKDGFREIIVYSLRWS